MNKQDVLNLFKEFDIVGFNEIERDGKTGLGKIKHWHTFEIIAKKNAPKDQPYIEKITKYIEENK